MPKQDATMKVPDLLANGNAEAGINALDLNKACGRDGKTGAGPMAVTLNRLEQRGLIKACGNKDDMVAYKFADGITKDNFAEKVKEAKKAARKPAQKREKKAKVAKPVKESRVRASMSSETGTTSSSVPSKRIAKILSAFAKHFVGIGEAFQDLADTVYDPSEKVARGRGKAKKA